MVHTVNRLYVQKRGLMPVLLHLLVQESKLSVVQCRLSRILSCSLLYLIFLSIVMFHITISQPTSLEDVKNVGKVTSNHNSIKCFNLPYLIIYRQRKVLDSFPLTPNVVIRFNNPCQTLQRVATRVSQKENRTEKVWLKKYRHTNTPNKPLVKPAIT